MYIVLMMLLLVVACVPNDTSIIPTATETTTPRSKKESYARQFELDITHYLTAYNNKRWEDIIDITYPKVYGNKTRDEKIMQYIQAEMMGMLRITKLQKIEKISDIITDKGNLYAKIYFGADVVVALSGEMLEKKEYIKTNLELSYDTQAVEFDEKLNAYTIKDAYVTMLAISEKGSNLWKYIEIDKQKEALLPQIIPAEILAQLD
jgi:hypothetical protein